MITPSTTRSATGFWDRIAPKYARKPIKDLPAYEETIALVRAHLKPNDRVLEIGCGTGGTALRLAPSVAEVTATDASRVMIDIARAKLGDEAPRNVVFQQADASDPTPGGPFDVVCAFNLLHLIGDRISGGAGALDPAILASVRRRLKPGGLFISKTVCLADGPLMIRVLVRALTAIGLAPPVTALSSDGLTRSLTEAGFTVERVSRFGSNRINPFIIARRSAR